MSATPRANRIDETFARLKSEGCIGLFPYLAAGYPDRESCVRLLRTMADAGADGFELGIPFSDPLADGVTMQKASARALDNGMTLAGAFDIVAEFRQTHDTPIVMMSYVNPLLQYGYKRLCDDAARLGVDGFIVPDMPLEEAAELGDAVKARGIHYIYFLAPTSNQQRIEAVGAASSGFIYCVALVGTTGARAELSPELPGFLARARAATSTPLVVGFGISTPAHVAGLVGMADGAIVSSALANLIDATPPEQVEQAVITYVQELRAATAGPLAATR